MLAKTPVSQIVCGKSVHESRPLRRKNAKLEYMRVVEQNWSFLTTPGIANRVHIPMTLVVPLVGSKNI